MSFTADSHSRNKGKKEIIFGGLVLFLSLGLFSFAFAATPTFTSVNPNSGLVQPNNPVNFTATYSDPDGWQDIADARLLINTSLNGANGLYLYYNQNTNLLYLRNDANTAWLGGVSPGSSNTIENSFVKLNCALTTAVGSGTNLTLTCNITFKPAFLGLKQIYLYVRDDHYLYSYWQQKGTYEIKVSLTKGKPVTLIPPTYESYWYCFLRGYTKDKLVDGITRDDWYWEGAVLKRSLAYPGGMWYEAGVGKYILFDYAVDLQGYYDLEKIRFHWGYFGDHPSYTYVSSWKFFYADKITGQWVEYPNASGASKPWEKVTTRTVILTTNKIRIKAYGLNWAGLFELEAFGNPSSYHLNHASTLGSLTPASGTTYPLQEVTFTATYTDPDGWQDLQAAQLLINTSSNSSNGCLVYYDQNSHKLYLRDDANSAWLGGFSPGTNNIIENSSAKLNCSLTTVSGSINTLTINWKIALKSAFSGVKNVYLYVKDDHGAEVNFTQKGDFCIFKQPVPPPND